MDFAVVPPEVTSGLIYAGPGSAPLIAAATAWDEIGVGLENTAAACAALIQQLEQEWQGLSSTSMAETVTCYVDWLSGAAGRAAETAGQARAAAAGYEMAHAAVVPPAEVAENRATLALLVATNLFGQNSAAIAANQAEYAEMWAQDAAAMYGYSASAAAATELTPFGSPERGSNPGGGADQAASAGQAAGTSAADNTPHLLSAVPQTLQQLTAPLQAAAPVQAVPEELGVEAAATTGLGASSGYQFAIGSANFFQRLGSQFLFNQPVQSNMLDKVDRIALATGALTEEELEQGVGGLLGPAAPWLDWLKNLGAGLFHSSTGAGMGQAAAVGKLSVPHGWSLAAPAMSLASAEGPSVAVGAAAAAGSSGVPAIGTQAALGGGVGSALGSTLTGGSRDRARAGRPDSPPAHAAAEEIAKALREYASLRDDGVITDVEFNKHKERLMSLDPLSGR